jgi:cobalt-zinc-cadmium efflux system membrane fusion protein
MTLAIALLRRNSSWVVPVSLCLTLSAAGCTSPSSSGSDPSDQADTTGSAPSKDRVTLTPEAQQASGIAVAAVVAESRSGHLEIPALLQVNETRTSRLGSLVDGVVMDADVQVGERVRKAQVLASIHSHAVHDAWAGHRKAIAERQRVRSELNYAVSAEGRATRLLAAKAVSAQEVERAAADRMSAEQALVVADSEVRRALDELNHLGISDEAIAAGEQRDAVPVLSPIHGVVLQRQVTPGTAVTVGDGLFVVSDLSTLWAIAELDEATLPLLSVGRTAEIAVAAYPERIFTARVLAIGDTVNPETRRVTARIEVDNREGLLKPQMFATVRLATGEESQMAVVPSASVQQVNQQPTVFVEVSSGTFRPQIVTVGAVRDDRVEVTGVTPGTRIAVGNAFLLKSKLVESERPE